MRILSCILIVFIFSSCENDGKKSAEKKVFIVSKFNDDIEKRTKEAVAKNPDLLIINETKLYDFPKGAVNFIFLNNGIVYFYREELIWNWCGWSPAESEVIRRKLSKDSLHQIDQNHIYSFLKDKSYKKNMKNNQGRLLALSFSFENDTIKNFDMYSLLQNIESLGYRSYNIRRITQFEIDAINSK